jgi:hypothetical protein
MQIKCLFAIILLALSLCPAKQQPQTLIDLLKTSNLFKSSKTGKGYYFWPIFFGGGTFFFSETGLDEHWPGYLLSGGLTFSIYEGDLSFFTDVLYSYRVYEGYPQPLHYRIDEATADLALAVGLDIFYLGSYVQFPLNTKLRVTEWTIEDFNGLSRTPSFSFMCGIRIAKKNLGMDLRLLLGQGPGQFLSKELGDHWLGQISLGVTGGF